MIGENLKKFREAAGLTRKEVSDVLKISESTYGHYETNYSEPKFSHIKIMAKLFNKSISEIFNEETEPSKEKILSDVIDVLKRNGELKDGGFETLDQESQKMIIAAINKLIKEEKSN